VDIAQLPELVRKDDPSQRRFLPPWTVEEYNDALVRESNKRTLA
jgi:hypothetical protein